MSLVARLYQWWILDCQPLRRRLGIRASGRTLTDAYYGRYPTRYAEHAAEWAARQSAKATKRHMLTCALRWDGLGTQSVRAVCWHCGTEMPDPHARRECSVPAPDIKSVIAKEEEALGRMIDRARALLVNDSAATITGERLSYVHQTHGIDSSVAESILGPIPEAVHAQYLEVYAKHRATGAEGRKAKIVVAR